MGYENSRDREVRLSRGHCNSGLELALFFENIRVSSQFATSRSSPTGSNCGMRRMDSAVS